MSSRRNPPWAPQRPVIASNMTIIVHYRAALAREMDRLKHAEKGGELERTGMGGLMGASVKRECPHVGV
ncbi:hypothetical protein Bpfe_030381 [Biomphalaria pfeifferi]|uniref:Uncharacterized protein n=1 Tax=Biomphalaria pfeifferi TaxID=112525 RepID=A0AAD8EUS7_BIOPF|nr:hypothetical protein Bpfe_030381 [Biomphalaria pfeifferi]